MFEKLTNLVEDLSNSMPTFLAFILGLLIFILAVAFGLGIVFAWFCFVGWVLSIVYGALASTLGWPEFSYWFFVGVAFVINFALRKCISINLKKDE